MIEEDPDYKDKQHVREVARKLVPTLFRDGNVLSLFTSDEDEDDEQKEEEA